MSRSRPTPITIIPLVTTDSPLTLTRLSVTTARPDQHRTAAELTRGYGDTAAAFAAAAHVVAIEELRHRPSQRRAARAPLPAGGT